MIDEWKRVSREALTLLRDKLGPVQISHQVKPVAPHFNTTGISQGWDAVYAEQHLLFQEEESIRLLSLKEMSGRLGIEVERLGQYDEDNDTFA